MNLQDLGYNEAWETSRREMGLERFDVGRVVAEHKERYHVLTEKGGMDAEVTGNLRFVARGREDFPAVGDWVALTIHDTDFSLIQGILPRFSVISREAVGQFGEIQIIGTNIDDAFLIQAVDRDFNLNRLERYLTLCHASRVRPMIVLTKTDLISEEALSSILDRVRKGMPEIPVMAISNETEAGYETLKNSLEKGRTYCMLGSSGVGKSTLLNHLSGNTVMKTDAISASTNKGRHVTSHRELIVLANGSILIDNPGMREVGIGEAGEGLETTFDPVFTLAKKCRFRDCSHTHEAGCAVLEAIATGEMDRRSYESYLKMEKEKNFFESSAKERHKKDKDFGRMMKNYHKGRVGR
ncbi:MAG: ribosome small subunit-dependent GTPase A [Fibrobacteres bacterium CG2_30_45_31]|nr:MAG: ribosome small subunit-dependent GTPase A [Fibrobacteres bacterium CG2_30_45_31]